MSKRNTKTELLRIIAMLCIISGHALGHGKLLDACLQTGGIRAVIGQFLEALIMPAVNVLVIVSGYFGISSKFTFKKVFTLWTQVLFYSVFLYFAQAVIGKTGFSLTGVIKAAFPVCFNRYWFFSVYICMYLLTPFFNMFLNRLSFSGWQCFLGIMFVFCVVAGTVPGIYNINPEGGNGIIWFFVLWATGAYLRKYPPARKTGSYIGTAFICLVIAASSVFAISFVSNKLGFGGMGANRLSTYTSFPIYFASISIVQAVLRISEKDFCNETLRKTILFFSGSTFSVYMIHENPDVSRWLWKTVNAARFAKSYMMPLILLAFSITVFIICVIIDKMTWTIIKKAVSKINTSKIDEKISKWVSPV